MDLIFLAKVYRVLNLYTHHAHNLCSGTMFMQDHEFFGQAYALADDFYDQVIERHIGTVSDKVELKDILAACIEVINGLDDKYYENLLVLLEESCCFICEFLKKDEISEGTKNLLQGQADQLEVLIYKIKRRLLK